MKLTLNAATLVLFVIIQMTACRKKDVTPPPEPEKCLITGMTYTTELLKDRTVTATFSYNDAGNPVSVIVSNVGTANPHALFLYDQYNRLTDYIAPYSAITNPANMPSTFLFEYWVRYVYADQNPSSMPVGDTLRVLGRYTEGKFEFNSTVIETLAYDSQGRIIRSEGYDANGNLIMPRMNYDNRKNYRLTNKVWMLIDKNFSVNNPFTAITYNAAGYPVTFPEPPPPFFSNDIFLRRSLKILTMTYSCTAAKGGSKK